MNEAKKDYEAIGGWKSLRSGTWLWDLVQRSFKAYWANANVEYFEQKYGTKNQEKIAEKLISIAAKNAAVLGGVTGAAVSADELAAFFTAGEGFVGIPANLAVAAIAIGAESILLIRIQLQMVAQLGKLHGVPLDPDDPEDILTILAFSLGGSAAEAAGKFGMKVGGTIAGRAAKAVFKKETLAALKKIAAQVGIKVLQKSIVKYTIPIASIGIGGSWNYFTTKSIAKIAIRHYKKRMAELVT